MSKVSILVPTYNEEENVTPLSEAIIREFETELPEYEYEIIFIDNDSQDNTRKLLRELCNDHHNIKAIFNAKNFGQFNSHVPREEIPSLMVRTMSGQGWTSRSNVIFYWSFTGYRAEWRYGPFAHKINLIDMGHVGENLYLACAALGLGTCGVGYYDQKLCDEIFRLDGEDEFTVYTQTVGLVKPKDGEKPDYMRLIKELDLS